MRLRGFLAFCVLTVCLHDAFAQPDQEIDPTTDQYGEYQQPDPAEEQFEQYQHPDPAEEQYYEPGSDEAQQQEQYQEPDPAEEQYEQYQEPDPAEEQYEQYQEPDPAEEQYEQYQEPDPAEEQYEQYQEPDPAEEQYYQPGSDEAQQYDQYQEPAPAEEEFEQYQHPDPAAELDDDAGAEELQQDQQESELSEEQYEQRNAAQEQDEQVLQTEPIAEYDELDQHTEPTAEQIEQLQQLESVEEQIEQDLPPDFTTDQTVYEAQPEPTIHDERDGQIQHAEPIDQYELTRKQQEYLAWAESIWQSLDKQHGEIKLPSGVATLRVPEEFYYLNPKDAETVLVEVWGNAPTQAAQGMLLPSEFTPFDRDTWGVIIHYDEIGYVSDKNADSLQADKLLAEMQKQTEAVSKQRSADGRETIELVGWAAKPVYDSGKHKFFWATELQFGNHSGHTLHYGFHVLGRQGVLTMNFVAGMDKKPQVDEKIDSILAMAEFDRGYRYEDFVPDSDPVASDDLSVLIRRSVDPSADRPLTLLTVLKEYGLYIAVVFGILLAVYSSLKKMLMKPGVKPSLRKKGSALSGA